MFCSTCWEICAPPEPLEKCPHCFEDAEGLCRHCKRKPDLVFARAYVFEETAPALYLARRRPDLLVDFLSYQWARLDWLMPDVVIAMPGAQKLALDFSKRIRCPFVNIIRYENAWNCDAEAIDTDLIILVISRGNSLAECQGAIHALSGTFLKRGYLLSLFPYDVFYF